MPYFLEAVLLIIVPLILYLPCCQIALLDAQEYATKMCVNDREQVCGFKLRMVFILIKNGFYSHCLRLKVDLTTNSKSELRNQISDITSIINDEF